MPEDDDKVIDITPKSTAGEIQQPEPELVDEPSPAVPEKVSTNHIETHVDRAEKVYNIQAEKVVNEASEGYTVKIDDLLKVLKGRSPYIRRSDFKFEGRGWGGCKNHSIVLLTSYDYVAALDVAYQVMERSFADCESYYLDLSERDDISVRALANAENRSKKPRVILVELAEQTNFLDSIKQATITKTYDLITWLIEQNTTVLCATSDRLFDEAKVGQAESKTAFQHCLIPFLDYVLEDAFGPNESKEVEERLREQRRAGRWPHEDGEFFKWVKNLWEKGPEVLRHEIELRGSEEGLVKAQPVKSPEIFPEELSIDQIVIWAAIYFEELTLRDFESVVLKLIEKEAIEVEEVEEVNGEDGESSERKIKVVHHLIDIWNRSPDTVLRRCELKLLTQSNGRKVIDFAFPYLRQELRQHVESEHPMLSARIFDKLQGLSILLDQNLSSDVIEILIRLAVERTLQDNKFYDEKWFLGTVMEMTRFVSVSFDPEDGERERFLKVVASLHGQQIWGQFCRRLSELIREMLRHEVLEPTVDRFLKMLLHIGGHHAILDIVIHITGNLRYVHNFDSLYWMKLLLDQGRDEIRTQTYEVLHRLALGSGPRVYEFLAGIQEWLPDSGRDPRFYSLAQRLALQFIMVFALGTSQRHREANRGKWPSDYTLFRALDRESDKTSEHLELLFGWMLHQGLPEVVSDDVEDKRISHHETVADVVESWIWILEGIRPCSGAEAESVMLADEILLCLHRHAGRAERRIVEKRWYAKQRFYLECLNATPVNDRTRRLDFKAKRLKIIEVGKRFKKLKKTHPSTQAA